MAPIPNPIDPEMSPTLRSIVSSWLEPYYDGTWRRSELPKSCEQEAWRAFYDAQKQRLPVEPEHVKAWLMPILGAVQGTISEQEFQSKLTGMWIALQGFPIACFTAKTLQTGLQRWKWFPSPAEVCELLGPVRDEVNRRYEALLSLLQRLRDRPTLLPTREPELSDRERMTQEERDAFIDAFRVRFKEAVEAARSPSEQIDAVTRPESRYFTTEQLAEAYRREGLRDPRAK
jgi:hypothetical protein